MRVLTIQFILSYSYKHKRTLLACVISLPCTTSASRRQREENAHDQTKKRCRVQRALKLIGSPMPDTQCSLQTPTKTKTRSFAHSATTTYTQGVLPPRSFLAEFATKENANDRGVYKVIHQRERDKRVAKEQVGWRR